LAEPSRGQPDVRAVAAPTETRPRLSETSLILANVRGFAILMVLAFHSFIAYLSSQPAAPLPFDAAPYGWTANPIVDTARWLGFDLFCAFQYAYLMHLMFFLSGLFVWPSLVRKGPAAFLRDRLLRLGLPFVLGVYLLMPLAYYPVYRATAADAGWSAFWSHWLALPFWPCGPLWFLSLLLVMNIAAVALWWVTPNGRAFLTRLSAQGGARPALFFAVLIGASAAAYLPLALVFKPWQWVEFGPIAFQPSFALPYAVYFFAGVGLGWSGIDAGPGAFTAALGRHWARWVGAAPIAFMAWILPTALIMKAPGGAVVGLQQVADLGFVLSSATTSFGMIALFSRFGARSSAALGSLSAKAYGIYLVHYVFVIWLQYLLLGIGIVAIAKGAVVLTGTLGLSWAVVSTFSWLAVLTGSQGRKREFAGFDQQGPYSGLASALHNHPQPVARSQREALHRPDHLARRER
jgi:peptidoglycan/LPS O-acetylase OafA/YrhL